MNKTKKRAAKRLVSKTNRWLKSVLRTYRTYYSWAIDHGKRPCIQEYQHLCNQLELRLAGKPVVNTTQDVDPSPVFDDSQLTWAEFQYFHPDKDGQTYHRLLCAGDLPRYGYDIDEYEKHLRKKDDPFYTQPVMF